MSRASWPEISKPSTTVPEQPSAPDDQPASGVSSGESSAPQDTETSKPQTASPAETVEVTEEPVINEDDAVTITNNGIAVVGTRALMLYGGSYSVGEQYAGW